MGRYNEDIQTILTLLAAGLDPEQGIAMYTDALGDKRERQDERRTTKKYLMSDLMPTLQSGADWDETKATVNALGGAYGVGDKGLKNIKQSIVEDFYKGKRGNDNVFLQPGEGEDDLGWDASDEDIVKQFTEQGAAAGYGRAEIRERLTNRLREQYGEKVYQKYRPNIHQAIDLYFPAGASAYGDGDAIPDEDNWMTKFDDAPAPAPTGGVSSLSRSAPPNIAGDERMNSPTSVGMGGLSQQYGLGLQPSLPQYMPEPLEEEDEERTGINIGALFGHPIHTLQAIWGQ